MRDGIAWSADLIGLARRFGACTAVTDGVATLDLRVGSGTYVRSIADAAGGHCRTLRRTEIGPFRVDEADDDLASARFLAPADALARLPEALRERAPDSARARLGAT